MIPMPLTPGARLGPYEILSRIGAGGMGEVYKAKDTRLGRPVAIKTLLGDQNERFAREARAIAALNHPHICQLYDIGPDYLVMEFIDGAPLKGPLAAPEAVRYAVQICEALEAAHQKHIIHRDLKPANILVTPAGIKLLDFGLALLHHDEDSPDDTTATISATQAGTILGTAAYMSPEQAEGKVADARSDIFSFGLVLYEMLSGRRAFAGASSAATMAAILLKEPDPLDAPAGLQRVVARCLRKSPGERFQSMAEVREALLASESAGSPTAIRTAVRPALAERGPSIAVLPFANMSADREQEYFSDGLAEEILNLLAHIPGLKVIARTSAFAFRGKEQDIRQIADTLGVGHVLEGSVRRAGNRIRVTAQLIEASDGTHVWSERYDRDMTDVFAIQDEISQAISEALKVRLAPRAHAVNLEAYQSYLKGQYYLARNTPESLEKAKEFLEQALSIDGAYAPAQSGVALYYSALMALGIRPSGEVTPLAKAAAQKALAIDAANTEAHSVLATVAAIYEHDWKLAEIHFRSAMASEPVAPPERFRYAVNFLLPLGRVQDAVEQSRLALETDPISMLLHAGMCWSLYHAKRYRETIEAARKALEIAADSYLVWYTMGVAQLHAGGAGEATGSLRRAIEVAPWFNPGVGALAAAYHRAGDREQEREWAQKLAGPEDRTIGAAFYHAATGEADAMFAALDGAYRRRDWFLISIASEPFLESYREDPRYRELLRRMNLPVSPTGTLLHS